MESLPKDTLFEFNPDTLQYLRKQYDLEKPGRIKEAIDILEEWLKKQEHFTRREFPRDYLERMIIISKGSVERAKAKLDKLCAFRTLFPEFYGAIDVKSNALFDGMYGGFLPNLTADHYRVYAIKIRAKRFESGLLDYYRYFFMQCEYLQAHDYCNGLVLFMDYREADIMELVKVFNMMDLRNGMSVIKEGYGMRIKGLHFLTESKAIDALVAIFKQVLSAKLATRIQVHRKLESIYDYIPKDMLPDEYGGKEMSLLDLHKKFQDALTSEEFKAYLDEMKKARTNEDLRKEGRLDDQYLGIPGTFRTLSVD